MCICTVFRLNTHIEKMFWPVTGHPGLAPDISRQVPDIPGVGHPRPCAVHLKAGAGHPGLAPDISRQVPDIPGAGHPRCRTSRPCAGHLKAGAGHLKTGTGHPGQALDFLMNSIKDHKSSPRSKSLTLPVANWPTECLRTKPSTLLGSHSFLLLSKVSFSSS